MPQKIIENCKTILTKKYFCFEGRADRAEFWLWILATFVVTAILGIIPAVGKYLSGIFSLAVLLPGLGVTARRLHDRGKSGWMMLLALIPVIGILIVLILCIPEGDKAENKFGAPAAAGNTPPAAE